MVALISILTYFITYFNIETDIKEIYYLRH